ncbi:hypothetical protein MGA5115_02132 [Marinomonas gallaica]|uniref:Fe-S protein n=1 Tax=Marinomonas gallaica TaxID=1806667 RepID=A0A1C3JS22_9GAMM|nr:DUF1289 domain-containing protein [Marinomonas gallaica]SBT18014.1 hypothetical protein MGA5115_02132 [Marinomonas gallaica]SBT19878.1 hypothetical protein MGA5116_00461 [Marinomonas gallaica]
MNRNDPVQSPSPIKQEPVRSPCTSICSLNDEDVCIGCYRTGVEISQWGRMSREEQLAVMEKVRQRECASQFVL